LSWITFVAACNVYLSVCLVLLPIFCGRWLLYGLQSREKWQGVISCLLCCCWLQIISSSRLCCLCRAQPNKLRVPAICLNTMPPFRSAQSIEHQMSLVSINTRWLAFFKGGWARIFAFAWVRMIVNSSAAAAAYAVPPS
jgi:hypothetical protein